MGHLFQDLIDTGDVRLRNGQKETSRDKIKEFAYTEVRKADTQLPDICLERTVRFTGGHLRRRRAGIHLRLRE
jgi:hypothetical protein